MKGYKFSSILLIVSSILTNCVPKESTQERPNIILILTDDQRWDALGYAGNDIIETPEMDALASNGIYFDNAFVTTPICAASRASILSGLYERTHNYTFGRPNLRDEILYNSYPYLLKKSGYKTGFVGKLGVNFNGGLEDSLFDESIKTAYPYFKEVNGEKKHLAEINTDHAIDFIKKNKGEDRPFCLSISYWSPHARDDSYQQYYWPAYLDSLYLNDSIPRPASSEPEFFQELPDFLQTSMNRVRWYWRFDSLEKHQRMVKGYYRMITTVDAMIGRIRNTLEEEGLEENTVVMLMGDNGYFLGERGYAGKWTLHEPSIRVPLIVYDPRTYSKMKMGKTISNLVLNLDLPATILDLAGVKVPQAYQGKSLLSLNSSKNTHWRSSIFLEHRLEGREDLLLRTEGIRDETWKFIRYDDHPDFIELYNHRADPNEEQNLAYDARYLEQVKQFQTECDSIKAQLLSQRLN